LRKSDSSQSSRSQVLRESKGCINTVGLDVIQTQHGETQVKAQAPAGRLDFGVDYNGQESSEDFDEIVPSWYMGYALDMDVQNFGVIPSVCETTPDGWDFSDITQFEAEWLSTATMGSNMARATEVDTLMNYELYDSNIRIPKPAVEFCSPCIVEPLSKAPTAGRKSSSSELMFTIMDPFESDNEMDHGDDGTPSSLGSNMGYDGKDTSRPNEERNEIGTIQDPRHRTQEETLDHFQTISRMEVSRQVTSNENFKKKCKRSKRTFSPTARSRSQERRTFFSKNRPGLTGNPVARQDVEPPRSQLPEPPYILSMNSDLFCARTASNISARTLKPPEFGEGVECGVEAIGQSVSDPGIMFTKENHDQSAANTTVKRNGHNTRHDLSAHRHIRRYSDSAEHTSTLRDPEPRPPSPLLRCLDFEDDAEFVLPKAIWMSTSELQENLSGQNSSRSRPSSPPHPPPKPYPSPAESGKETTKGKQDSSERASSASTIKPVSRGDAGRDEPRAVAMAKAGPKVLVYFTIVETPSPILQAVVITQSACVLKLWMRAPQIFRGQSS
jgi:hypothetical protein